VRYVPLIVACFLLGASQVAAQDPTYWQDIRPIFRKHCNVCHSTKNLKELDVSGGLALDTHEAAIKGAKEAVFSVGKSGESSLIKLLKTSDENRRMPKDAPPLPPEVIARIGKWIDSGAKEGVKPDTVAAIAPAASTKRTRYLDVVLPTNATPPPNVLGPAKPAKLELALKVGPLAPVTALAFSPDGKLLASGAYGQVTVWDLTSGQPSKVLTNVLGAVNDLKFSPDGKLLAVAGGQPSFRGDFRLFDTSDWSLRATLGGHEDVVYTVAFTGDGQRLASASFDKTVRIWDLASHKTTLAIPDHSDFVYGVAFSPDGKLLASCSKDRSVKLFDAATGKSQATLSGMNEDVIALAFGPDGKSLVSSGLEPGIVWWNAQTSERVRSQGGHGIAVHELAFSKDGKRLLSAGADGTARLWDGTTGAAVKSFAVASVTYAAALSPDGKRLATGSFDGLVRLWDVDSGRHLASLLSLPMTENQPAWLVLTPEGYAAAADGTRGAVQWRMGGQAVEAEAVWKTLGQSEVVAGAMRGEAPVAPSFK
jgi:WD40 repeat protein